MPTKMVQCFSNDKAWVTPELKALLNGKKRVFRSGDRGAEEGTKLIKTEKGKARATTGQRWMSPYSRTMVWRGLKLFWDTAKAVGGIQNRETWNGQIN